MSKSSSDREPLVERLYAGGSHEGIWLCSSDAATLTLSVELTKLVQVLATLLDTSFLLTLLCGWAVLLGRWCGSNEVVVGTRAAKPGRDNGLIRFESTELLRIRLHEPATMEQLVKQVTIALVDTCTESDGLIEQILRDLRPASVRCSQTYQVLMRMDDSPASVSDSASRQLPCVTLDKATIHKSKAELELSLRWANPPVGHLATPKQVSEQISPATIESMSACVEAMLNGMLTDIHKPLSRLPLMSTATREQVLHNFNASSVAYPCPSLIHEMFEAQVRQTPGAVALLFEQKSVTYEELNCRANQLARYLRDLGVRPDDIVGLCIERSVEMVVGLFGILKAGGAYLPLDPAYPHNRLSFMLRDASPRVLLTQERLTSTLPQTAARVVWLDRPWGEIASRDKTNLDPISLVLTPQNLAYVIYTSGSTGQPKGVEAEHRGMVNRIAAQSTIGPFRSDDICCQKISIGFVDALFETLGPLSYGRPLVIATEAEARDVHKLVDFIARRRITRLVTVPSLAQSLLDTEESVRDLQGLRSWTLSGEELKAERLRYFHTRLPKCVFTNLYGSSEVAADATYYISTLSEDARVPIGRPIPHTPIYILDAYLQPTPIGVAGEIYVGGPAVARGYINRPDLTVERFVPDPFNQEGSTRLFKSGDLGRWRADGMIDYLGRNDRQVKVRGFRIELGEIESQIERHAQVREAIVILREEPGENRLVAYMTRSGQAGPSPEDLREFLRTALPEHMVPVAFVTLDRFPLTPTGKVDRRAFPPPEREAYASRTYESVQGEREGIVAGIWKALLCVDRVGRNDNFYELGGHSLLIMQMMEELRQKGFSIPARNVFQSSTLAELARALTQTTVEQIEPSPNLIPYRCGLITPRMLPLVQLDEDQIEGIALSVPEGAVNIQDIYPLAPLQAGMLFHHLLDDQDADTYVVSTVLSVCSRKRLDELISALQGVINRHDVLRSAVLWEKLPQPVQVVYRHAELPVEEIAWNSDFDLKERVWHGISPERQGIDVRRAPLMRLQVASDPRSEQWYALLHLHHLIDDDVSLRVLISEVVAHLDGRAESLPTPVPYRNHVAQGLAYARTHSTEAFFRKKLGDIYEPTAPFGLLDVHGDGSRNDEARQALECGLGNRLRRLAQRLRVGVATLFHAVWALVLAHASARDDVVFGTVLLGRFQGYNGSKRVVGMFVNTLPLRLRIQDVSARELVEQTHRELAELLEHEQAPLAIAHRCARIAGSGALFSATLNYRHCVPDADADWASAAGIEVLAHRNRTNYPCGLSVDDLTNGFLLTVQTDRRVDPQRVIGYVQTATRSLVEALEQDSQTPAMALPIVPKSEHYQLIRGFNLTQRRVPNKLVHVLFEDQARRTPDAIAVACEGHSLTYSELNGRANQLAWYLRVMGVGPDRLVALCIERSLSMVVGLLGVLKAGGAYVPLDPTDPAERMLHVLHDAQPRVVLTHEVQKSRLPPTNARVIALDSEWEEIAKERQENLDWKLLQLSPQNLAYVIYTSGSTGKPKGVMVEHRNLVNYVVHAIRQFDVASGNGSLICASISFDLILTALYPPLLCGRTVWLCSEQGGLPGLTDEVLRYCNLAPLKLTPSHLALLEQPLRSDQLRGRVRVLVLGGEPLQASVVHLWKRHSPSTRIFNHYGPTEATVGCIVHEIGDTLSGTVPIGRPISNTQIYILNCHMQPVPIGVAGEIYIGGAGVARGYLNRPELTVQRFVPDAFGANSHGRLYKSGDLGRWRDDGTIEFLGRNDHQVKVRGHRVELGEIESELARHLQVAAAAVLLREDVPGEKSLVAYVTLRDRCGATANELRAHLRAVLPEYMVPSAFVVLKRFPMTPNGKLNRSAFPVPEFGALTQDYEVPVGDTEEMVAKIWQKLLPVVRVGRNDNFFDIGGHSLLAMQVIVRIQAMLSIKMAMRALFDYPTVKQLSAQVDDLRQARLRNAISTGGSDLEELLERVASLPDTAVQELVRDLKTEGRI